VKAGAMSDAPQRKSVTQTLPFWIYVFAAAGLAALMIMGPRFGQRQAQIERNYQGRVRANQRAVGEKPSGGLSTPDSTIITLTPLYVVLVAVLLVAWFFMWRHFAGKARTPSGPAVGGPDTQQAEGAP